MSERNPATNDSGKLRMKPKSGIGFGLGKSRREASMKDFHKIRSECLTRGLLWEDPKFAAENSSLWYSQPPPRLVEWKRPGMLVDEPRFVVEGVSRFDVRQGDLGNCWLLAAIVNLTMLPSLFARVVPRDQGFGSDYAGIFRFRFWRFGAWVEVLVDDRLPTCDGSLFFVHSTRSNEFWSALLEKAYAKLVGSYEALMGGNTSEAMTEFTGGITEMYNLEKPPVQLYQILLKAYERNSMMSCSIKADPAVFQKRTPEGLVMGHAYSITRVQRISVVTSERRGQVAMLRLRNPWGSEDSWTGPWSDNSPEWLVVPDVEKENINLSFGEDGEFWIAYRDFARLFDLLEICNLTPDALEDEGGRRRWKVHMYGGEWVRGVTAGGCRNYLDTFDRNPQYRVTLTEVDDGDSNCTLVISLMQKNRRTMKRLGKDMLPIGFVIYRLERPVELSTPLDKTFFKNNASVARSPSFVNTRQVCCRFQLEPGVYCVVPSTFEPDQEGEFLLRIFSEKTYVMEEHDNDVEYTEPVTFTDIPHLGSPEDKRLSDKVTEHFLKLGGKEQEVVWLELKEILDLGLHKEALSKGGFSKDTCRSMIAMFSTKFSGKLGLEEFKWLWEEICRLRVVYRRHADEPGGRLCTAGLREALGAAGYTLGGRVLNMLAHRYAGRDGHVSLDDFIMCAVRLQTMIHHYHTLGRDHLSLTLQQWIMITVGY